MALTREQEEYYDALDEMFGTKGWKIMIEEATALIYQAQADALEQPNWDAVNVLRGKAMQLAEIVNFEETSRLQRQFLEEEDDADL